MKNYDELSEFLETKSGEEKAQFLRECNSPLLKSLILAVDQGDSQGFEEAAIENKDQYVDFVNRFNHASIKKILLVSNLEIAKVLIYAHEAEKAIYVLESLQLDGSALLSLFEEITKTSPIAPFYNVKDQKLEFPEEMNPYLYLKPVVHMKHDDDFDLLSSVTDRIPMELISQGGKVMAVVKNNARNDVVSKKESIIAKLTMFASRVISSPYTKYAGAALAIGLVFMGSAEAADPNQGVVDALEKVGANWQESMSADAPSGCNFGVKVINKNALGITYRVDLGDYSVKTEYLKSGRVAESVNQSVLKLKEMKGCGLTKSEVIEMANKLQSLVKAHWH